MMEDAFKSLNAAGFTAHAYGIRVRSKASNRYQAYVVSCNYTGIICAILRPFPCRNP